MFLERIEDQRRQNAVAQIQDVNRTYEQLLREHNFDAAEAWLSRSDS